MNWIAQHKALIITTLITGILVFGMFSIHITKRNQQIFENFYAIETEPEKSEDDIKETEDLNNTNATDKAYNEDEAFEKLMKNFKTLRPNDFERTTKAIKESYLNKAVENATTTNTNSSDNTLTTKAEAAYKKLQDQLNKRLDNQKQADEHSKTKSTLTYSLKDRTLSYYKTPRYLCEFGGKVVVSINVNASGNVLEAYINGASSSNNQCLIDSALDYAKSARFNVSERANQLGTITFLFKGKL